jgi:hypothetical protein
MMANSALASLGVAAAPQKPTTAPKADTIDMPGLENYAALSAVAKEITDGILKTHPLRDAVLARFAATGKATGRTPANFKGVDGRANASIQLRKKTSASPLKADATERLADLKIAFDHVVTTPATVIVNPKYMGNAEKMNDVLAKMIALVKKAGYSDDFFQLQQEVSVDLVTDQTLSDIFLMAKDPAPGVLSNLSNESLLELLNWTVTPTIVSKWDADFAEAVKIAKDELAPAKPDVIKPTK